MTETSSLRVSSREAPQPPYCFVSHAWAGEGHAFAVALCTQLQLRGIRPWLDEEQILPGADVERSCRRAVLRDCEVFVALVGASWHASGPCQRELRYALERRDRDGLQIVPVHWEREAKPAPALGRICYISLRDPSDSASVDRLAAAIRRGALIRRLVRTLSEGGLGKRHEAAQLLGRIGEPSTLSPLCRSLVQDDDPLTRYWSAIAIGSIGAPEGCGALRDAGKTEAHPFVLEGIQDALERACRDENV